MTTLAPTVKATSGKQAEWSLPTQRLNAGAVPKPSSFGVPAKALVPVETHSFTDTGRDAIRGTFFMAVRGDAVHVQIPVVVRGTNRATPEYYQKVVTPIVQALAKAGRPLEKRLDAFDVAPRAAHFTPEAAKRQLTAIKTGLESLYGQIGITADVQLIERPTPLTALEKSLLAGGEVGDLKNPDRFNEVLEALRRSKSLSKLSDPTDLTLLLHPFPDVTSDMVPTTSYGPTLGEAKETALHEVSHYLFMNRYEGYYDAFAPPNAVMGDLSMNARLRKRGENVAFSPQEKSIIFQNLFDVAADAGLDTKLLKKRLTESKAEVDAIHARAKVARFRGSQLVDAKSGKPIEVTEPNKSVLSKVADRSRRALVVYDAQGKVESISFTATGDSPGYRRVVDGELFLTDTNLDFTIDQLPTRARRGP